MSVPGVRLFLAGFWLAILATPIPGPTGADPGAALTLRARDLHGTAARTPSASAATDHWFGGFALPILDGDVHTILPWRGGVVIGGRFQQVGGVPARNIAFWDGATWHSFGEGLGGVVACLCEFRGDLIAGGALSEAEGPARSLARWDGSSWADIDGLAAQHVYAGVTALVVFENTLVVGGEFDRAGSFSARNVACWDGTAWSALGDGVGELRTLAVFENKLYAGCHGYPGTLGALVRWDGASWASVDGVSSGDRDVLALAPFHERLIVAGQFDSLAANSSRNCAAWNGTSWEVLGSGAPGPVAALAARGDILAAGGWGTPYSLHSWNGIEWQSQYYNFGGSVWGLANTPEGLWAGGNFETVADYGHPGAIHLGLFDGARWNPVGPWKTGMRGLYSPTGLSNVTSLVPYHDGIAAAGTFRHAGTGAGWVSAGPVASWDGVQWKGLQGLSQHCEVRALLSLGDTLIAGGRYLFPPIRGPNVGVALYDGVRWSPLDTLDIKVNAIASFRGDLYAAGQALDSRSYAPAVYRWQGARWLPAAEVHGIRPFVFAMQVHQDRLVVGGSFDGIGSTAASRLAAWDGAQWTEVPGHPLLVTALGVHEGRLMAGCDGRVVVLGDGEPLEMPGLPFGKVSGLVSVHGHVFAGLETQEYESGGPYEWNGSEWLPLEGRVNGPIRSLLAKDDYLYVGGLFTLAGTHSSFGIARWGGYATPPAPPTTSDAGAPNPFDGSTTMAYTLEAGARVRAAVLDLGGREIVVLADGWQPAGVHSLTWDGRDRDGRQVRPGVYVVRAHIDGSPDRVWKAIRLR